MKGRAGRLRSDEMTLNEFDRWANAFLKRENFCADISMNGIQVQNSDPDGKEIRKVAFAVDACLETIQKAAAEKADILFVHHGLFWGEPLAVAGSHYNRIKALLDADMALYASHIPLDANSECGNNYGLARMFGMEKLEPFGEWRGMSVGVKGEFAKPVSVDELVQKLESKGEKCNVVLPFGSAVTTDSAGTGRTGTADSERTDAFDTSRAVIKSAIIISGDGESDAEEAAAAGVDAFITGEAGHVCYHLAKENRFTIIGGGHYNTETIGVSLVMEKLSRETKIQTVFISAPTGL